MSPGRPPPERLAWISEERSSEDGRNRVGRFIENHPNWVVLFLIIGISAVMALAVTLGSSGGPALVYDPQVVHRQITTSDGRTVDCAVSHSGMSCDWTHPVTDPVTH